MITTAPCSRINVVSTASSPLLTGFEHSIAQPLRPARDPGWSATRAVDRAKRSGYHPNVDTADIDWIPEGTRFGIEDMTFFAGRGERDIDDVLADIDLVVTGPHASAAFPAELQPFVDVRLTRRLQYDFTDVSTSPVTRRWAEIDPHMLYIEDPHPWAVRDANRARPVDPIAGLREAFHRLDTAEPDSRPSLEGVDATRPVTFGYLPVLRKTAHRCRVGSTRRRTVLRRRARVSTPTKAFVTT